MKKPIYGVVELENGLLIDWLEFRETEEEAIRIVTAQHDPHVVRCEVTYPMKELLDKALWASDLLQGFVNQAVEQLDKLAPSQKIELLHEISNRESTPDLHPTGAEEAGCLAILKHILENED